MGGVFFLLAQQNFFQKKKRKKRKRFTRGWISGCKLFDLKIFNQRLSDPKQDNRKNFKRNPEGLNLQERKTCPQLCFIFFISRLLDETLQVRHPTPLIQVDEHSLTIGTWNSFGYLTTDETSLQNELIFWKTWKNRFDNCWIDIVHDLFEKWGMCKIKEALFVQSPKSGY